MIDGLSKKLIVPRQRKKNPRTPNTGWLEGDHNGDVVKWVICTNRRRRVDAQANFNLDEKTQALTTFNFLIIKNFEQ